MQKEWWGDGRWWWDAFVLVFFWGGRSHIAGTLRCFLLWVFLVLFCFLFFCFFLCVALVFFFFFSVSFASTSVGGDRCVLKVSWGGGWVGRSWVGREREREMEGTGGEVGAHAAGPRTKKCSKKKEHESSAVFFSFSYLFCHVSYYYYFLLPRPPPHSSRCPRH